MAVGYLNDEEPTRIVLDFVTVTEHPVVISLGLLAAPVPYKMFFAKGVFARWLEDLDLNLSDFNLKLI